MTISFNMCFIASFFTHSSKKHYYFHFKDTKILLIRFIWVDIKYYNLISKVHYILYSIRATIIKYLYYLCRKFVIFCFPYSRPHVNVFESFKLCQLINTNELIFRTLICIEVIVVTQISEG